MKMEFLKTARAFVAKYIGEFVCGAISVRQLIIWDWFGAIISVVVAVVIFVVNRLKA
jgi:hypothetical protein